MKLLTPELEARLAALIQHWRERAKYHGLDSHIGQVMDRIFRRSK